MDSLLIVIFIVFAIGIFTLTLKQLGKNNFSNKSSIVKKHEIIDGYKKRLDNSKNKDEKNLILKDINQELARNIFFNQDELKQTMQNLIAYSIK